nr:hypothetical protein [uncultured Agathobaculum sp.]
MNENNSYSYTPIGTKWLWFITYISFPLGALSNILALIGYDFASMDNTSLTVLTVMCFFFIALPISASIFLHKRRVEGYFLSVIVPLSNAFFVAYIWLMLGSNDPAADLGAILGALIIAAINYFYMKKRRFLFTHNEIGPGQFNAIGAKTALIVCLFLLVVTTLYSAMLQGYNAIDQQAYSDLLEQNNEIIAENDEITGENDRLHGIITDLNQEKDELTYKADFVDNYVRFVTETGEKYHCYECQHIQNAPSIYYIFIDDPGLSYYSPCSDCNP